MEKLRPEMEEPKPLYSDIAQVRALWDKLDQPARRLLLMLYQHKIEKVEQINPEAIGTQIAPFVLIDKINNYSLPLLGDRILSIENREGVAIAEDFADEMELIARDHPLETLSIGIGEQPVAEAEDPWQSFLAQLTTNESGLLSRLVKEKSVSEEDIDTFARSREQVGTLLIDLLNEKAIEQLGRTPFYPDDGSWFIEQEDLGVLSEIVQVEGA